MHNIEKRLKVEKAGLCHRIKPGSVVPAFMCQYDHIRQEEKSYRCAVPLELLLEDTVVSEDEVEQGYTFEWVFPEECTVLA